MKKINLLKLSLIFISLVLLGLGCKAKDYTGGVFMSTDYGETWQQKVFVRQNDDEAITISELSVYKIVQDHLNESSFFLATDDGVWLSDNRMENWQKIGLNGVINDLAVDPTDSTTIIAANGSSVYKTQENFQQIDNIYINPEGRTVTTVLIDPYNPKRYFAGCQNGQLVVSNDGGITWSSLYLFNREIKNVYQAENDTRVLYLATKDSLYRSTDAGENWLELRENLKDFSGGNQVNDLYIDPNNYSHIYLATDYGLLVSQNAGESFEAIKTLVPFGKLPIYILAINPDDLNQIYFVIDRVIHKSTDGGANWKTLETLNTRRVVNEMMIDRNQGSFIYLGVKNSN